MAYNKQGGFPNPNAKLYDRNGERRMEASESLPRFETSKDNGVQGGQFSSDGSHQNYENTPRPARSYPHEMRGNYRGRGRGQRNYDRDGSQQGYYYGDPKKVDNDQRHQQRVQPGPYQGHYQDNRSHSYQGQEGSYSRQASSGGGARRDNFDQQQKKRNRVEDLELTPITSAVQVPMVLHGTYYDAWNSIKKQGLCRFKCNYIHFAAGEPGENDVISVKKLLYDMDVA